MKCTPGISERTSEFILHIIWYLFQTTRHFHIWICPIYKTASARSKFPSSIMLIVLKGHSVTPPGLLNLLYCKYFQMQCRNDMWKWPVNGCAILHPLTYVARSWQRREPDRAHIWVNRFLLIMGRGKHPSARRAVFKIILQGLENLPQLQEPGSQSHHGIRLWKGLKVQEKLHICSFPTWIFSHFWQLMGHLLTRRRFILVISLATLRNSSGQSGRTERNLHHHQTCSELPWTSNHSIYKPLSDGTLQTLSQLILKTVLEGK